MKKILFVITLFYFTGLTFGQAGSLYFRTKLDSILKRPLFDSTQISIAVYDLTDGSPVFSKNEKMLLRPASTLKILTTAAAYKFLGPDYKFTTNLYIQGEIKDSTLTGNLYVEGGFDPELKIDDLSVFLNALKKSGIKKINGNLFADISKSDSLFLGKGWMWDDDSDRSFPYLNSLPINKNSIKVITSPAGTGQIAAIKMIPETGFVSLTNRIITDDKDSLKISVIRNWVNRKNEILAKGWIGTKSKADTSEVNIVYPEKYFLYLFTELLKKSNISFSGRTDTLKTPAGAKLTASITHSLTDVITITNKESDNLNAEMLLRVTAYEQLKRKISAADGIKFIDNFISLAGIRNSNYRLTDGSGASFYNLLTTGMVMEILKYIYNDPVMYKTLSASFPTAGVDGTLLQRLKEFAHLKNIYLKTGTLSGVSDIAGFITTTHGHVMATVIYIQNFTGSPKRIRDLQDEIIRAIYLIKSDKEE